MDLESYLQGELAELADVAAATARAVQEPFSRLVEHCTQAVEGNGKLLFFGNGGSAADAQHLAAELVVRYRVDRPAIPAIALTTDTSILTATANDYGYECVFARQIEALGRPGDVAIGISTSGKSANVNEGLRAAALNGLVPAAFSGGEGGELAGLADPLLLVPSKVTARIQELHIFLGQALCAALERRLGLVS